MLYIKDCDNCCFCSVMNLLAEIYSQNEMIPSSIAAVISNGGQKFDLNDTVGVNIQGDPMRLPDNPYLLSTLAPRLWPFMRHNIRTVRFSAIRTLVILFDIFIFRESNSL